MKQLVTLLCSLCLLLASCAAHAKQTGKGQDKKPTPKESTYEHASDNAKFKRGSDWQGNQDDEDETEALKGKGEKSKDQKRDRERQIKKKGKGEQGDADMDVAGEKKRKQSDDENGDAETDEPVENREKNKLGVSMTRGGKPNPKNALLRQ